MLAHDNRIINDNTQRDNHAEHRDHVQRLAADIHDRDRRRDGDRNARRDPKSRARRQEQEEQDQHQRETRQTIAGQHL